MADLKRPVLFISYSWTSPDHEQFVLDLATELRATQQLDVRLDKWLLLTGDDAIAYMEQQIPEADKVLIVSDCAYVEKANNRKAGAGIEAQILTPELYKQYPGTDPKRPMGKYAVAVTERDEAGEMCIPRFYGGRIYVDLTDPEHHADRIEDIGRWAHDKPVHVLPEIGGAPAYLDDRPSTGTRAVADHARRALADGRTVALRAVEDYFDRVVVALVGYVPKPENHAAASEDLIDAGRALGLVYTEVEQVLIELARARLGSPSHRAIRKFFTALFPYVLDHAALPDGSTPGWDYPRDVFRYLVPDLFLAAVAALLDVDDVEGVAALTSAPYAPNIGRSPDGPLLFTHLQPGVGTRDLREALDDLRQARTSRLDDVAQAQADFVLLLASGRVSGVLKSRSEWRLQWSPTRLLNNNLYFRRPMLPLFQEAESRARLDRLSVAIGTNAESLLVLIDEYIDAENDGVRGVPDLTYRDLTNRRRLGTQP